jgi:uncharacterized protein
MAFDKELLSILACPLCKGKLSFQDTKNGLLCDHCRLLYPIEEDIPVMLAEKAKAWK